MYAALQKMYLLEKNLYQLALSIARMVTFVICTCTVCTTYVNLNKKGLLSCPFNSTDEPITWSKGVDSSFRKIAINNDIQDEFSRKFIITGNHSVGEYNLQLLQMAIYDKDIYRCETAVNGTPVRAEIDLRVSAYYDYIQTNDTKGNSTIPGHSKFSLRTVVYILLTTIVTLLLTVMCVVFWRMKELVNGINVTERKTKTSRLISAVNTRIPRINKMVLITHSTDSTQASPNTEHSPCSPTEQITPSTEQNEPTVTGIKNQNPPVLNYVEVCFNKEQNNKAKFCIQDNEKASPSPYADIDLSIKADPLPETERSEHEYIESND